MSKVEVDQVTQQSGTTLTVGGGACKTAVVDATTVTLGRCGGTVSLASGATQSGFGRTGTVDWQTGSIKTTTFTAVNGEGYFANTSGGAFTMNLPAGSAGAIVSVVDYTNTFQTFGLTVSPDGSEKIGGVAASKTLTTEGQSVTFVYVDGTEGWKNTMDSTSNVTGNPFLQATGGTVTTSGNCKIHTFTGPGTFTVSSASTTAAENVVSYLVVAGGGGGGNGYGGGGGAGGFREVKTPATPYTASPLDGYPTPGNRITVTAQAYPITVGAGGAPGGNNGCSSTFDSITSAGGGYGRNSNSNPDVGSGGSGGGGNGGGCGPSGAGNTPPTTPAQGTPGGTGGGTGAPYYGRGGGGGATDPGTAGTPGGGGAGGDGGTTHISGTPTTYAGGGGGGHYNGPGPIGAGGPGGGGAGAVGNDPSPGGPGNTGQNGTINTGGGAGGGSYYTPSISGTGGTGGSGIVIIRYKFQ